jgi:S1-C subfamily serine protease
MTMTCSEKVKATSVKGEKGCAFVFPDIKGYVRCLCGRAWVLVALVLMVGASALAAPDWVVVAERLEESVMQISDTCSAFSIDDDRDYVLTAKHCTPDDPTKPTIVDLVPAKVVADDVQYDFTVLHVPGMDKRALALAEDEPKAGTEVISLGYGMGLKKWMFRHAWVSNRQLSIPDLDGEWIMIDGAFVGGQSGGPVVNAAGEVVAVVQRANSTTGIGRGSDMIRKRVGKYFTRPKP